MTHAVKPFTLFCFHHAGGSGRYFRAWSQLLPAHWRVVCPDLPGRGDKLAMAGCRDWSELTAQLLRELGQCQTPFAFFGHSLGARVAFELALALQKSGQPLPLWLGVSACRAPSLPSRTQVHTLADEPLAEQLQRLQQFPAQRLTHPEVRQRLLAQVRDDFYLAECAPLRKPSPLACALSVFSATDDEIVNTTELPPWQDFSHFSLCSHQYAGRHFYLEEHSAEVCAQIDHDVSAVIAQTGQRLNQDTLQGVNHGV
ncbi:MULTISPECIES: alpha/beta fold hydrolase [unclassified Pseudoalteromonas]|uniref:thioesterase II family protein n=1 Tax=unclassified Pseudoalteromonas TaxID=194690 RepID=UPI002096D46C|nr:alpha/beta fold hydrolase [Pseudoalteromonas sp. XMcav2-N]MCO7190824.1 alpha/beta fold hydrolase [Pseudoalteromonas sp. XMcav2-N]